MAQKAYGGISNIARNGIKLYGGVNNIARNIIKGYVGDENGIARQFWGRGSWWRQETDIPYNFYQGAAVIFQGKVHLIGGAESPTAHYSWDGENWVQESTLPHNCILTGAIVWQGKLYIFGSATIYTYDVNAVYSWDGYQWTQEANTPVSFHGINRAHIFKKFIHLIGSDYNAYSQWRYDSKFDGSAWTTFDMGVFFFSTALFNDKIYLLGDSGTGGSKWAVFDGNSVTPYADWGQLPYLFQHGFALKYGDKIHMLGSDRVNQSQDYRKNHYVFDGQNFTEESIMPYNFYYSPAVVYKGRIHIFGGANLQGEDNRKQHWSYGLHHRWKQIADSPIAGHGGSACVYHGKIHLFNGTDHYSFDGTTWTQESTLPGTTIGGAITVVYNDKIYLLNNRSTVSGVIGFYAWDGSTWIAKSTAGLNMTLYGMNNGCVYDGKITVVSSRHGSAGFFRRIWQYEEDAMGVGTWTNVSNTGNIQTAFNSCCTYNGEVHYAGNSGWDYSRMHYKWDGSVNTQLTDVPYGFFEGFMLEFEERIHFIGSSRNGTQWGGNCRKNHYTWDGWQYEEQESLIDNTYNCPAVVYNGKIYLFGNYTTTAKSVFVYE